jgi:hypothetical protein
MNNRMTYKYYKYRKIQSFIKRLHESYIKSISYHVKHNLE